MDFDSWTSSSVDRERRRRLFVGYAVGAVAILTTATVFAMTQSDVVEVEEEEAPLEVALVTEPEPEPEPEPEAAPEPEPAPAQPRQAGPVMPTITTPTDIPDDAPKETEVDPNANPYASGDPFMYAGQGGTARTAPTVVKAEVAKPITVEKAEGPGRVTADTTPPAQLSMGPTAYPAAAKAAGIEGTVIVKMVVDEQGNPTDVRAVKGPEELRANCEDRFKGAKYSPAVRDGKPVAVQQVKKCVYKLTT